MSRIVLLHGSWLGGWMWDDVADRLERKGHDVLAPDFSGDGDLNAHRDEVLGLIDRPGVVIVAHSYAGMPATAAAAEGPDAIAKIVYLDAYVPRTEQTAFDILPDIKPAFEGSAEDGYVAPLPLELFGITDAEQAAKIGARLRGWPLVTHTQASPGVPDSVDTVFLQLAQGQFFDGLSNELEKDGWIVERLDLAHLAPITHPDETAEALLRHV